MKQVQSMAAAPSYLLHSRLDISRNSKQVDASHLCCSLECDLRHGTAGFEVYCLTLTFGIGSNRSIAIRCGESGRGCSGCCSGSSTVQY